ncbi:TM2 domain-containing protein [Symbioplanes lichenis]|uniref:TM2 domain-containing protein n=1 Tax=Symbioplanes lichenis TaxID=1629072 RepID=UPI0027398C58|nr:TM2 domain-containing protein [Actinoplanes lichenis]
MDPAASNRPAASLSAVNAPAELPAWEQLRVRQAESDYAAVAKDVRIAYALWCVTGILGGHRFYLGDTARSMAMLFTLGGLGLWTLADVFFLARRVRTVNRTRRAAVMARYHLLDGAAEPTGR